MGTLIGALRLELLLEELDESGQLSFPTCCCRTLFGFQLLSNTIALTLSELTAGHNPNGSTKAHFPYADAAFRLVGFAIASMLAALLLISFQSVTELSLILGSGTCNYIRFVHLHTILCRAPISLALSNFMQRCRHGR